MRRRPLVALAFLLPLLLGSAAYANTGSFDSPEYTDAHNGDTKAAVENECNCDGHMVVDTSFQGAYWKAVSYTRNFGGGVTAVYRRDTDGTFRLKMKSSSYSNFCTIGYNDFNNAVPSHGGAWIAGSDCGPGGGGDGGGGSWKIRLVPTGGGSSW